MAPDESAGSKLKRCPRCETLKDRTEITSQGYCRPCSRAYSRERDAKKRGSPLPPRAPKPAPPAPPSPVTSTPTTISDVVRNVCARGTKPAAAPRETPAVQRINSAAALTDRLACAVAHLADVLEDGEMIELTITRIGSVLVLRDVRSTLTRDAS